MAVSTGSLLISINVSGQRGTNIHNRSEGEGSLRLALNIHKCLIGGWVEIALNVFLAYAHFLSLFCAPDS